MPGAHELLLSKTIALSLVIGEVVWFEHQFVEDGHALVLMAFITVGRVDQEPFDGYSTSVDSWRLPSHVKAASQRDCSLQATQQHDVK
jgi:hypothetical protein